MKTKFSFLHAWTILSQQTILTYTSFPCFMHISCYSQQQLRTHRTLVAVTLCPMLFAYLGVAIHPIASNVAFPAASVRALSAPGTDSLQSPSRTARGALVLLEVYVALIPCRIPLACGVSRIDWGIVFKDWYSWLSDIGSAGVIESRTSLEGNVNVHVFGGGM
jgi:hypothetical protein